MEEGYHAVDSLHAVPAICALLGHFSNTRFFDRFETCRDVAFRMVGRKGVICRSWVER